MKRTYSKDGPICPHCQRQFTPDEAHYYDEHLYTSQDCDECGKTFSVSVNISASWSCEPIEENAVATSVNHGAQPSTPRDR